MWEAARLPPPLQIHLWSKAIASRNRFMTWWEWKEWIYTHGNSALVEVYIEGPCLQTEGMHEENPYLVLSTPDPFLVTVRCVVDFKLLLLTTPLPLPYHHRQYDTERVDSFTVINAQIWSCREVVQGHICHQPLHGGLGNSTSQGLGNCVRWSKNSSRNEVRSGEKKGPGGLQM